MNVLCDCKQNSLYYGTRFKASNKMCSALKTDLRLKLISSLNRCRIKTSRLLFHYALYVTFLVELYVQWEIDFFSCHAKYVALKTFLKN